EWPERLPEDYWPPARYRILIRMAPPQGAATVGPGGSAPGAGPPGAGASPGRVLELQGELPAERLGELLRARGLEAAPGARAPSPRPGPHP
ncbi:MAG: hypothetical protein LBG06_06075, partial [Deltaproteobacteria bacterium]|nr:hypothetical protein [Deltaproteobacteria bacterium]